MHYQKTDGSIMASVGPNLFGPGFVINLAARSQKTKQLHRTDVKFILPTERGARGLAKTLVKYGVKL